MNAVKPSQLTTAARIADALVYATGVAGVIAGGLLFRGDEIGFAIVAWVLTFVAGAGLRLASWATRALAELLTRTRQIEDDLAALRTSQSLRDRDQGGDDGAPPDPYRRWGTAGWH